MGGFNVTVGGIDELQAKFKDLGEKAVNRANRKALQAGADVVQAAILERTPTKDLPGGRLPEGAMRNDSVVTIRTHNGGGYAKVGWGALTGYIAHWVEYGHRLVRGGTSKSGTGYGTGKEVGFVPAHPFIRPAYEASRLEAAQVMADTAAAEIEKSAKGGSR